MARRVSIKDIAEAAGVTHSTVSRAIHGTGRMTDATRDRILKLAEEMGYSPDALARSLVSGETHTIGVVVTTIADPFVVDIVNGIEAVAHQAGYSVFLSSSHTDPDKELAVVKTFHERRVDAVIVSASRVGSLYSKKLQRFGVPIVLINNQGQGEYLYSVTADDVGGAQLAVEHLVDLGHKRIAYIGSAIRPYSTDRRKVGYRRALQTAGIEFDQELELLPEADSDLLVGRRGMSQVLSRRPTAIFAYNDLTAVGAMLEARERGIDIPSQLSLIGFDDIQITEFISPTLTTIRQPREAMGGAAMNMVLSLLRDVDSSDISVSCELVLRESTTHPAMVDDQYVA